MITLHEDSQIGNTVSYYSHRLQRWVREVKQIPYRDWRSLRQEEKQLIQEHLRRGQ